MKARIAKWTTLVVGSLSLGWGINPPHFPNDDKFVLLGFLFLCVSGLCLCSELDGMSKRRDDELS